MTITNTTSAGDIEAVTAGDGLSGGGTSGAVSLALDLNELTAAAVDVSADSIAIIDAGDSSSKKESIADLATAMAKEDDIDLTDDHWDIINFLREYYEEYQIAPAVRVLTKAVGKKLGKDKGNSKYLYELFPYGPGKQACKFAGLPKLTGCV